MPLTYVLAANAGVVAAVAAAVAVRIIARRRVVVSDMSTPPAPASSAAISTRRIIAAMNLQQWQPGFLCTASHSASFVAVGCQPLICNASSYSRRLRLAALRYRCGTNHTQFTLVPYSTLASASSTQPGLSSITLITRPLGALSLAQRHEQIPFPTGAAFGQRFGPNAAFQPTPAWAAGCFERWIERIERPYGDPKDPNSQAIASQRSHAQFYEPGSHQPGKKRTCPEPEAVAAAAAVVPHGLPQDRRRCQ